MTIVMKCERSLDGKGNALLSAKDMVTDLWYTNCSAVQTG